MKIQIDQTKCIGCGTCCALCSDIFAIGDKSKAILQGSAAENKNELVIESSDCAREAAQMCPAQCIEIKN